MTVKAYMTKSVPLSGTDYKEVSKKARLFYNELVRKTKRRPYIKSKYFGKEKIFLETFWHHLYDKKSFKDKLRRMKYLPCAIELLQNSTFSPTTKENNKKKTDLLHRFTGVTKNNDLFFVQVREDTKKKQKWLMSVFPMH